jgi:hypothetical protein
MPPLQCNWPSWLTWPSGLTPHSLGHETAETMIAWATLGTAVILGVTAVVIWAQLRETQSSRFATLAADLTRRWDEPLLAECRRETVGHSQEELRDIIKANYDGTATVSETKHYYMLQMMPNFVESIAAIEGEFSGLSVEFVDHLWGGTIIRAWQKWSLAVAYAQSQPGAEKAFENFERLARKLAKRRGVEL